MFLEVTGERQIPEGDFRFLPDGTKVLPYGRSARKGRSSTRTVGQNRSFTENQCTFEFANGGTVFHAVGTCRMGSDDSSVLDPQLRLRGVENLRVIDASVMPLITSANSNATSLMIGEKGAALIKSQNVIDAIGTTDL